MKKDYLIWSNEHGKWWRPDGHGYTHDLAAAGRYTRMDAITVCQEATGGWRDGSPPPEIPVLAADAEDALCQQ